VTIQKNILCQYSPILFNVDKAIHSISIFSKIVRYLNFCRYLNFFESKKLLLIVNSFLKNSKLCGKNSIKFYKHPIKFSNPLIIDINFYEQ